MKKHIKIFNFIDFYLTISRDDPYTINVIEIERNAQSTRLEEEQLERNLDRINMWISNCDQKTSFLLTLLGVALTIILSSDAVKLIKNLLINPFLEYWRKGIGDFDCYLFFVALLLIVGFVFCFSSVFFLLLSLRAKTNYNAYREAGMEEKSLFFFGTISKMTYSEFSQARNNRYNDLTSQVYVNSIICTKKYNNYKKGLLMVLFALPMLVIAFLLILFMQY